MKNYALAIVRDLFKGMIGYDLALKNSQEAYVVVFESDDGR